METTSTPESRAKSYAERSKLKRKVLQLIKDKYDDESIVKEIEKAGEPKLSAKKLLLEMKIERIEEVMRTTKTALIVGILIAAGAGLMVYLWDDQARGGRGYNYFVGAIFLPLIFAAILWYYRLERNSLRFELNEKTKQQS